MDPYLRAAFSFLATPDPTFKEVLAARDLLLSDRVAFALRFLSDEHLPTYLTTLTQQLIACGDLEGLLVTGMRPEGVALLGSYLDISGDVQTVSSIAAVVLDNANLDTPCKLA
jgi:hypothetical protein